MTESFSRKTSRSFVVAPDFPVIVALCAEGELLKKHFRAERDAGKIVVVLSETFSPELNTSHIAIADELFIANPDGNYDDFQAAMYITAKQLEKHIRVLK